MTDDPAPDPNDGLADSAALEEDIDRLLADAATLATDVSEEVGEADGDPSVGAASHPDQSQDVAADVDAQLANIEAMAAEASAEVGSVGDGPADADSPQPPPTATEPGPDTAPVVPDFMAEFTRPEPPTDKPDGDDAAPGPAPVDHGVNAAPSAPATPTAAELAKKGVVSSKTIHATGAGTALFGDADDEFSIRVPGEPEGSAAATNAESASPAWLEKASPVLLPLAEFAVRLLERLDAPTARIGGGLRQVIGWLAIATFGTSLIVLLISFF